MSPAVSLGWSTAQPRTSARSAWGEDADVRFSADRYRVLDEDQQQREEEDVARIIGDMEAQRRERGIPGRRAARREPMTNLRTKDKREPRRSSDRRSCMDLSGSGDQLVTSAFDGVSQSFQKQILLELQKLKETQLLEFEALERLKREKDEAERKARRLEMKLREQEQRSRKEGQRGQRTLSARNSNRERDFIAYEGAGSEDDEQFYSAENKDFGDMCEKEGSSDTEGTDPEVIDWDDQEMSPPPYCFVASPATSPFKRTSGWPSWCAADESAPPGCDSRESPKSRSRSKIETFSMSRRSSSGPSRRSLSRSPSATRSRQSIRDSQRLRRSGAFFEEKARAQAEAEQREKEAADRLERACRAAPPKKLLEREAVATERRSRQMQALERRVRDARDMQVKARGVPISTYLTAHDAEEAEQSRKIRIRQRAQDMFEAAKLPPQMEGTNKSVGDADASGEVPQISVKMKKKLVAAAEEVARRQKPRPKPVPKFDQLHAQWEASMKRRKEQSRRSQDEGDAANDATETMSRTKSTEFFKTRKAELVDLQARKEARKQRQLAKEEVIRQHAKRAQEKVLARARASGADVGSQRRPTKSETLRVQKLTTQSAKKQKEREREEREAEARERRREEAVRRVRAQVKQSENIRRDNYAGNFVALKSLDELAKEKVREQRQQYKEAIARNREKLLAAAATRPSLMERFTTGVKRETHRRSALEAVVKTVFQNDLSVLKGVLTDDEQELAREMVAADDERNETLGGE